MGAGAALALQIIMGLLDRAGAIATLINAAQKENRDITPAELDGLAAADDAARAELAAAIAKARNTHPTPR